MSLSRLTAKCRACPFVDDCDHKEMEALGYLPLPEPAAQPTEIGYRNVENLWNNPKMLIGSDPASEGLVSTGGEIDIDAGGLVRTIVQEIGGDKMLLKIAVGLMAVGLVLEAVCIIRLNSRLNKSERNISENVNKLKKELYSLSKFCDKRYETQRNGIVDLAKNQANNTLATIERFLKTENAIELLQSRLELQERQSKGPNSSGG